jgi:hypothetical protein
MPAIRTVGDPGTQGAGKTGIHVPGVKTPLAATVWAAVIGLAMLWHLPKVPAGGLKFEALLSIMLPAGFDTV